MDKSYYSNYLIQEVKCSLPRVRQLKQALENGANINYQTMESGYTPLMYAVMGQKDRVVEYLLKQGADPLIKSHNNKIASELTTNQSSTYPILKDFELLFATQNNDLESIKELIQLGVSVDFQGAGGYTALMIAVEQSNIRLVGYLLSEGADFQLTRSDGLSVYEMISDANIEHLLEGTKTSDITNSRSEKQFNSLNNFFVTSISNTLLDNCEGL